MRFAYHFIRHIEIGIEPERLFLIGNGVIPGAVEVIPLIIYFDHIPHMRPALFLRGGGGAADYGALYADPVKKEFGRFGIALAGGHPVYKAAVGGGIDIFPVFDFIRGAVNYFIVDFELGLPGVVRLCEPRDYHIARELELCPLRLVFLLADDILHSEEIIPQLRLYGALPA